MITKDSMESLVNQTSYLKSEKYPQINESWLADYLRVVGTRKELASAHIDKITYFQHNPLILSI